MKFWLTLLLPSIVLLLGNIIEYSTAQMEDTIQNLSVMVTSDCNQLGAAVVLVTWDVPENSTVLSYEISLSPSVDESSTHCLDPDDLNISTNDMEQTSFTIQATGDESHPLFGCSYVVTVRSLPSNDMETMMFNTGMPAAVPNYRPICQTQFDSDDLLYSIDLQWSTSALDCGFALAIDYFSVLVYEESPAGPNGTLSTHEQVETGVSTVPFDVERDNYNFAIGNLSILFNGKYQLSIVTILKPTNLFASNMNTFACSVTAPPIPPSPVTSIRLIAYTQVDEETDFSITWLPPGTTNGNLAKYEVRIGVDPIPVDQQEIPVNGTLWQASLVIDGAFSPYVEGNLEIPEGTRVVFQIRSTNENCQNPLLASPCVSDWSYPLLLNSTQCYPSSPLYDTNQYRLLEAESPSSNEEEVALRAKCFATCSDEIKLEASQMNQTVSDCTIKAWTKECYRGCVTRYEHPSPIPMLQCTETCFLECRDECAGVSVCMIDGEECFQECRLLTCRKGCMLHDSIIEMDTSTSDIEEPSNPTGLIMQPTLAEVGGEYTLLVTPGSEQNTSNLTMVTLVRVESDQTDTQYLWRPYPGNPQKVNINYANCQRAVVSARLTNRARQSNYISQPPLVVYGEQRYPEQIPKAETHFFIAEDFREGFFGHAIINMSWSRPTNFEYLQFYQLRVFSQSSRCGGRAVSYHYDVDRDATSYVFQSESDSEPPVFNCKYSIRIFSYPVRPEDVPDSNSVVVDSVDTPLAGFELQCNFERNVTDGRIELQMEWQLVPPDPIVLEAYQQFVIFAQYIVGQDPFANGPIADFGFVFKQVDQYIYTRDFSFNLPPQDRLEDTLRIRLQFQINGAVFWRGLQPTLECYESAVPFAPSVIPFESIEANVILFTESNITVTLAWSAPERPYGPITTYEVVMTPIVLTGQDDPVIGVGSRTIVIRSEESRTELAAANPFPSSVTELFIQVRASNDYETGNWSDPYTISSRPPSRTSSAHPSPTSDASTEEAESELTYIIIGAVAGGFLLLCLFFTIVTCIVVISCRRRKIRKQFEIPLDGIWQANIKRSQRTHSVEYGYRPDIWELSKNAITVKDRISEGFFGEVFHGVVNGPLKANTHLNPTLRNQSSITVAIKYLKSSVEGLDKTDFLNEIEIMKKLFEGGSSPYVVSLVGCVTVEEPIRLVTALVRYGDLHNYLTYIRNKLFHGQVAVGGREVLEMFEKKKQYEGLEEFSVNDLLSFAYQIASGMAHISSLGIIHRDLACRNILLGEGKSLKISDFGMSREVKGEQLYINKYRKGRLPIRWMAIESMDKKKREFSSASDVWSYAVTVWEIATLGGIPYPTVGNDDLLGYLEKGGRLSKPEACVDELWEIVQLCWMKVPSERPDFSIIHSKLDHLVSAQHSATYIDLNINFQEPYYQNIDDDMFINLSDDDADDFDEKDDGYHHLAPPATEVNGSQTLSTNVQDV